MNLNLLLTVSLAMGLSTVLGCAAGLLIRKIPHRYNDIVLAVAAGIMLAAAVLGLLLPAVQNEAPLAIPMTVAGIFAGASLISILDKVTPHLHRLAGLDIESHNNNPGTSKVLLFISAIAIHKLPEGLAAGVSFGTAELGDIITVAGSIALQNIPEAMVIVAPLMAIGVSMKRTLLISMAIGAVSVLGTLAGAGMAAAANQILPFVLAFAGGTMLYVVGDEMIPETHAHGYEKSATFALLAGFTLVLVMQQLL
ncbi:MAG: ZIP family metal transporter [Victivallales bacterium]|nr:ZIP family metal transporter [Victivallales bacterium]